jgi:hypothetical protein
MTDRELFEITLDALEEINKLSVGENAICLPAEIDTAMDALREKLAQPERQWVGLTDNEADEVYRAAQEQINEYWESGGSKIMFPTMIYEAIEAKLKEKNT